MKAKLLSIAVAAAVLSACSSTPVSNPVTLAPQTVTKDQVKSIPDWYSEEPKAEPGILYATGTGVSRDLSTSVSKARLDAQTKLADKLKAEVDGLTRNYVRETNESYNQSYESLSRKVLDSVKLGGYTVLKQEIMPENGAYRTYIQLRYSFDDAAKVMRMQNAELDARKTAAAAAKAEQDLDRIKAEKRASENIEVKELGPVPAPATDGVVVKKVTIQ